MTHVILQLTITFNKLFLRCSNEEMLDSVTAMQQNPTSTAVAAEDLATIPSRFNAMRGKDTATRTRDWGRIVEELRL
jgi:hypothetical protein